jgi:hypothetical protein
VAKATVRVTASVKVLEQVMVSALELALELVELAPVLA